MVGIRAMGMVEVYTTAKIYGQDSLQNKVDSAPSCRWHHNQSPNQHRDKAPQAQVKLFHWPIGWGRSNSIVTRDGLKIWDEFFRVFSCWGLGQSPEREWCGVVAFNSPPIFQPPAFQLSSPNDSSFPSSALLRSTFNPLCLILLFHVAGRLPPANAYTSPKVTCPPSAAPVSCTIALSDPRTRLYGYGSCKREC